MPISHAANEASIRNMWLEIHERHVIALKEGTDARFVFLGDSLTDAWQYQPSWTKELAPYKPVNLGIGGDRTQHLLWRLKHHTLPPAPLFTLLIGTNNINRNRTDEIVEGIAACRDEVWRQRPDSKILILHLLPRQRLRAEVEYRQVCEVNESIPTLAEDPRASHADFSDVFQVEGEAHLNYEHMLPDHVHFTEQGYAVWTKRIIPELDRLLD